MTSGGSTPAPTQGSPPQPPTAPAQAVSPPNKRDLKSWWKGFKLQGRHQEAAGTPPLSSDGIVDPPFLLRAPRRVVSQFREGQDESSTRVPDLVLVQHDAHVTFLGLSVATSPRQSPTGASSEEPQGRRGRSIGLFPVTKCFTGDRSSSPPAPVRPATLRDDAKSTCSADSNPQGIFGVPLRQSITYANVAISLIDENGSSYIYGYVPIVVAKCGVFLKEKG